MRLAYSTNAYTRSELPAALRAIAALGYDGAEILCDRPHWFPGEVTEAELEDIAALCAELGLGIGNLNANTANGYFDPPPPENSFEPALTNPDPTLRRWRQDYTIEALRLASRLGARSVSVTAGRPTPGCPPQTALGHFVDSLQRICEAAARFDVRVGIEYEPGLLVERASEALAVIRRVDSPHLGVNFDIGHSWLNGEPPRETTRSLAGRIWNVHVEDIAANKHFHLVPGDGDLPFDEYFAGLRDIDYHGYLTVELYSYPERPDAVGGRALEYLRGVL